MNELLSPTWKKLLLFMLLVCTELFLIYNIFLPIFFPISIGGPMCEPVQYYPIPADAYQNPPTLIDAWKIANEVDYCNRPLPELYSPLVKTIQYAQHIIVVAVLLVIPYLVSCLVLAFIEKLKKQKKGTPKVKK